MKKLILFTFIIIQLSFTVQAQNKIERFGEYYIEHSVSAGETLYALSRKYHVTVEAIKKANNNVATLNVGQKVFIPTGEKIVSKRPAPKTHKVLAGETLYKVATQYSVTTDQIIKWNGLKNNELNIGQILIVSEILLPNDTVKKASPHKIHIVQAGETLSSIAKAEDVSVQKIMDDNPSAKGTLQIGQELVIKSDSENSEYKNHLRADHPHAYVPTEPYHEKYKKVEEKGSIRITYQEDLNANFPYCLHKTAPKGTIVTIIDTVSNRKIYARVMGKLSEGDTNILKVNKKVFEQIGVSGTSFNGSITFTL